MKRWLGIFLVLLSVRMVYGQVPLAAERALDGGSVVPKEILKKGIPGSHVLEKEEARIKDYLKAHPEAFEQKLRKGTAWNFKVGDQKSLWATSLVENYEYQVPATCRAVTAHAYVFVANDMWGSRVFQTNVDAITAAWEQSTPANSQKGVYMLDTETFGDPPDVDGDARIIILILDIQDGYDGGEFVAGYFFSLNEFREGTFSGRHSNEGEIYYMDCNPVNFTNSVYMQYALGVTAHEFQHMIHWNYDRNELVFLNEGLSETASKICGYDIAVTSSGYYTPNTDVYLFRWGAQTDVNADYARAARFGMYLWNQFPDGFLKSLVASTATGKEGINAALAAYLSGTGRGAYLFEDVLSGWAVANYVHDVAVDPRYGYVKDTPLPRPASKTYFNPNVSSNESLNMLGIDYLTFKNTASLSVTFESPFQGIRVFAVEIGKTSKRVVPVALNVSWNEPAADSWSEITFVVVNTMSYQDGTYSFVASGKAVSSTIVFRQENENGSSPGYLQVAVNDTEAVLFSGVPGVTLDSLIFAPRRVGTIKYGIREYSGNVRPSPSGKIIVPVSSYTVAAADTNQPPTTAATTRWAKIDLRSLNVDLTKDFLVAFAVLSKTAPGILVSEAPHSGSPGQSFTYIKANSGWYYYTNSDASIMYLYMVRAYGHISTPTGVEVVELKPKLFSLEQNYPNPFNPATEIRYSLGESQSVMLRIFDILGRTVRTLVEDKQNPGSYRVSWNGKNDQGIDLPSGVYFYELRTDRSVQSKKMILLR